ncbi:MAG: sugar phosphate nucleotidyltransferase [Candidatus Nanohaloarchaea archaeon]|nr:sugar phosphate nucleotidyltransferase [Candidatus Nanohaloarchaea archaeon]
MHAVVLAGGSSSRFWPLNTRHKCLLEMQGKTLLRHTLDSLQDAGVDAAVVVQGPDRDIEEALDTPAGMDVAFAVQEEPRGMGDALLRARERVGGRFVVTGPYRIDAGDLVEQLRAAARGGGAVAGTATDEPSRYGMLDLDEGRATGVVEKPERGEAPSDHRIVSTYLLEAEFFDILDTVEEHEYSFEDALDRYMDRREVGYAELDAEPPSLKYPWDALDIAGLLLSRQEARIADSAEVADSAAIEGNVVIADDVTVYENAVISGPCYIGEGCTIGTNALVRDGTVLGEGSTVGAGAEVRGSVIQPGFSMHSGFIGDSVVGRNVAVGAGTVTANRRVRDGQGGRPEISVHVPAQERTVATGRDRLGVLVGDDVDIGTQANLMPGVCIGRGTFIGPSAMVRENVGEEKRYFTKVDAREMER